MRKKIAILSFLFLVSITFSEAFPQKSNDVDLTSSANPIGFMCREGKNEECTGNRAAIAKQMPNNDECAPNSNCNHLVFPVEDTNKNRTAFHNRKPVVDSKRCDNATELLYPGDNEGDWICDCKPGFLFVPSRGNCFAAYRRGPCESNEVLVVDPSKKPYCVKIDCENSQVMFNGKCHSLDSHEGCEEYEKFFPRKLFLTVDPTTIELACIDKTENIVCKHGCCNFKESLVERCIPNKT